MASASHSSYFPRLRQLHNFSILAIVMIQTRRDLDHMPLIHWILGVWLHV